MKRRLLYSFVIFLFYLWGVFPLYPETDYYSSNVIGMAIEKIPWYKTDEYQYVLEVKRFDLEEEKRLIKDGKEIKRWKIVFDKLGNKKRERYYENGVLSGEKVFDKRGNVISRREFTDSKEVRVISCSYLGDVLNERVVTDGGGNELWRDRFFCDEKGRIIRVEREFPDGRRWESLYNISGRGLRDEVEVSDAKKVVFHYGSNGRLEEKEIWKNSGIELKEYIEYYGDSLKERERKVVYPSEEREVIEYYNEDGTIDKRIRSVRGGVVGREYYLWREGVVVEKKIVERNKGIELYRYFYKKTSDGKKVLSRKEHFIKGEIEKSVEYSGDNNRVEAFFKGGKVFLKRYYTGDTKTKEEIINNGKVIRERVF